MKKFLFALAVICLSSSVMKAQDWAQFGKYASANDTVKVKPVAVFMGDSITEGWYRTDPDFFTDNNFREYHLHVRACQGKQNQACPLLSTTLHPVYLEEGGD